MRKGLKILSIASCLTIASSGLFVIKNINRAHAESASMDFTNIDGFSEWTSTYMEHVVEYSYATVTFASANKNTQTIMDQPVTKGQPVSVVMKNGALITSASFTCTKWGTKTQTITLKYSTNAGASYNSTGVTSTNFSISSSTLNSKTNAVQITFSSSSNQVGIAACSLNYTIPENPTVTYTVTFDSNGGSSVASQTINENDTAARPANPTKSGYIFENWYLGENVYDFNTPVTGNITLTAHWNTLPVTNISNLTAGSSFRIEGEVISRRNNKSIYIQDATGAIEYYADEDTNLSGVKVGNTISLYAQCSEYLGRKQLSGAPITPIEILNNNTTIETAPLMNPNITTSNFTDYLCKYVSFTKVQLSAELSTGKTVGLVGKDFVIYGLKTYAKGLDNAIAANKFINVTGAVYIYNNEPEIIITEVKQCSEYTVTYNTKGGTFATFAGTSTYVEGDLVTAPSEQPTKAKNENERYSFNGWYIDEECTEPYQFGNPINASLTLYAGYDVQPIPTKEKLEAVETASKLSYAYTTDSHDVPSQVEHSESLNTKSSEISYDSNDSFSGTNFSVKGEAGSYANKPLIDTSYIRFYAGNNLVINCTNPNATRITKIVLNCTSNYAKATTSTAGTVNVSGNTITVTMGAGVSTKSVTLTNSDVGQSRISSIDFFYETEETVTETTYNFNNVELRFGGQIKENLWNEIKPQVVEYGVILTGTSSIASNGYDSLKEEILDNLDPEVNLDAVLDIADCVKVSATGNEPFVKNISSENYVIFNGVYTIDSMNEIDDSFTSMAYIKTNTEYIFLKEVTKTARMIATSYKTDAEKVAQYGASLNAFASYVVA